MEFFYAYYNKTQGPLARPEALSAQDQELFLTGARESGDSKAAAHMDAYRARRDELEAMARTFLQEQGGTPVLRRPWIYSVGACAWLKSWYREGAGVRLPSGALEAGVLTFTYGDVLTAFGPRAHDGKAYRHTFYTLPQIEKMIARYGLPQIWNDHGQHGPERYIEVQVWVDDLANDLARGAYGQ